MTLLVIWEAPCPAGRHSTLLPLLCPDEGGIRFRQPLLRELLLISLHLSCHTPGSRLSFLAIPSLVTLLLLESLS